MATQTGSIDLRGANSAKLYVDDEAGEIRTEVSETYATKTEVRRTDTGSGTVVSSDDAANLPPLSLTIHGKSVQDGTPSPSSPVPIRSVELENLLDESTFNAGVYSFNSDGSLHVSGVDGRAWASWTPNTVELDSAHKSYYWTSDVPVYVQIGTTYVMSSINGATSGFVNSNGMSKLMVKVLAPTGKTYPFDVRFSLTAYPVRYPLSFDSVIQHVAVGMNALPSGTDFTQPNSAGGVTVTRTDGVYTFNGTPQSMGGRLDTIYLINAFRVPAGTYRATAFYSGSGALTMHVQKNNGNNTYTILQSTGTFSSSGTYPTNAFDVSDGDCLFIGFNIATSGAAYNSTAKVMLTRGTDVPTEYVPFQGTATPIDLDGNSLRSLPDGTEDTLEVDGEGNVTLVKRVGTVTFTGDSSETWSIQNNGARVVSRVINDLVPPASNTENYNGRCEHFAAISAEGTWFRKVGFSGDAGTKSLRFSDGTGAMTVADWTAWLQANPLTVLYPLATEQTISLGKIDLPSLPSPSCSIHVDALVTPTLDAEWWTQGGEEVGSVYQRTSALEQDVDGLTLELSEKVDSSEEWVSWLHAGTDATTHEPYLAMGKNSAYPSVVYSTDAARFYDGEGDDASNVVASFGTEGVVVGKDGSANTTISDSEIVFHDANGNEAGKISMSSAGAVPASASHTITAGDAQQTYTLEGLTPLPDFTLGYLVVNLFYNGTLNNRYRYTSIAEAEFTVSIDTYNDATFTAAQSGDTWGATMTAQHRVVGETADFTFSLEWVYLGTAPIYEFGTTENTGAYSFSAGTGLVAAGQSQAVFGKYNKPSETDLFILGNGTSDGNRSNALKVDSQGTLETSGYFQSGGVVGLGTEAQQGWLTALGPFMRFAEVTTATQSISSGSVGYFSVAAPTYTGYTLRGAIQSWASGSGTVIIGASYRSSADNNMHFVVRANNTASVAVKALLLYTLDAITS